MEITLDKPRFNVDQVISASTASKRFGQIRKKAKDLPQFISDNNVIDTVVLNYKDYEKMYLELQSLRELIWEIGIARRLENADKTTVRYSLEEVFGKEEYEEFRKIDPNSIPDDEIFE